MSDFERDDQEEMYDEQEAAYRRMEEEKDPIEDEDSFDVDAFREQMEADEDRDMEGDVGAGEHCQAGPLNLDEPLSEL